MKWVCSRFDNIHQVKNGTHLHISKIIEEVRSGTHKDAVARIKEAFEVSGKSPEHQRLKEDLLPYFTPGGTFTHRSSDGLHQASQVLQGDVDGLSPRRLEWAINDLSRDPHLIYLFRSPSQNGIKIAFHVPEVNDNEAYKLYFFGMAHYLRRKYGILLDQACQSISHPCYLSDDSNAIFNPNAERFTEKREEEKSAHKTAQQVDTVETPVEEATEQGQEVLNWGISFLKAARDGTRHAARLRVGETIGGLIASGHLPLSAIDTVVQAARGNTSSEVKAEKTIRSAVAHGRKRPFEPSGEGHAEGIVYGADDRPKRYPLSDNYNAARMRQRHGKDTIFCGEWDKYFIYAHGIWEQDFKLKVVEMGKETALAMYNEALSFLADEQDKKPVTDPLSEDNRNQGGKEAARIYYRHAVRLNNGTKLREMVSLMRPLVAVSYKDLDTHSYLLPVENGVVNLRTLELMPHERKYLFTRRMKVAFDPKATCPLWEQTLFTIMGGFAGVDSPEESAAVLEARAKRNASAARLVDFLQEGIGMALSGDVSEHALLIFWGDGRNGKGLILESLMAMFGEYATKLTQQAIMQTRNEQHPTEYADLYGRGLVVTSETDKNRKLNLGMVKELSGGDTISARRMREDFWRFYPTHHMIISTNHKPVVEADDAIWERIYFIPFLRMFATPDKIDGLLKEGKDVLLRDPHLREKLVPEYPGILNWLLRGCQRWLSSGLSTPPEVLAATSEYRSEEDVVGRFLKEECTLADNSSVRANVTALFARYKEWSSQNHEERERLSRTQFNKLLEKKGYEKTKNESKKKWFWLGIGLPVDEHHQQSAGYKD